jgi:arylsulfatase A-like enzyme
LTGQVARLELAAEGGDVELDTAVVSTPEAPLQASERKPIKNVIILLIDTLRADKLQPYNPKTRVQTPGLSRFLRSASVMLKARTQENWTKPSVATLLSSLMPWEHNTFTGDAKLPAAVETLPEMLRKRGYATGAFIANGYVSDKFGFEQGFGSYRNYVREGRRNVAQYVAADVLEWLDKRPKEKPFFLYVHTIDPHVPYMPPEHFLAKYDSAPYSGIVDFKGNNELLEKIKIGRIKLGERDKQRLTALYDGEISYHDVHFAAMMDGLDKRGLAEDTMVVITSDHGEEFWDHGSVGHGHSIYDELLHIPLIVRIPGVTEGKQAVNTDVGLVDVVPTVFDALSLPMPENLSGASFLPDLLGARADAPRTTVSGFMTAWRTLAVGRMKLVQKGEGRYMLYDVARDPGEQNDIAKGSPIAVRYTRGLLGLTLAGNTQSHSNTPRVHVEEKTTIDPQTEAQLRALGYVGTSAK